MKLKQDIDFRRYGYPLALVILVLLSLLFIEYKHPYFFLQDDNRDSYLPYFVHNYESLLNGEIALYNFHQFLGIPSLATGQSATLYPITYLSVFLSDIIFGHYFAAIEIEVIIHLMIGAVGFYRFMRFFGTERNISLFGGLTWSLSSFVIYVSNSWVVVSAVAAYFPWMLFFSFCLYKKPSRKVSAYGVVVRLLLFYTGNVQYFIYSVIFEFITVILYVISDSEKGRIKGNIIEYVKKYVLSYINVLVFSLPLLLPMWILTTNSVERSGRIAFEVFASRRFTVKELVIGLLVPSYSDNGFISYMGTLVPYFLIIGIYESSIKKNAILISSIKTYVLLIPTFIAFLWSTSKTFNYIIYFIPILNRFRWPFKVALYFDFYIIMIASLILSNILLRYSRKKLYKNILLFFVIIIQILNLLILYMKIPYNFGTHLDEVPLEENFKGKLSDGRIISIGFEIWSPLNDQRSNFLTAPSLGFNYATLFGLQHFAGYDSLLSNTNANASLGLNFQAIINDEEPIPVEYLRKAGVSWYIVSKNKENEYTKILNTYNIIKKYEDENRVIFYDDKAYPMVFNSEFKKIDTEDYYVTTNTIQLTVEPEQSDTIIFNNIFNSYFEGYIDGEKVEIKPINDIHFCIDVPKGKHNIVIKYNDPYFNFGIHLSLIFFLIKILYSKKEQFIEIRNKKRLNISKKKIRG